MTTKTEGQTVNALAKFYGVDRSTIQRVVDRAELEPVKAGAHKKYNVGTVGQLVIEDRRQMGYNEGFKVGKAEGESEGTTPEQDIDYEKWRETRGRANKLELDNAERQKMLAPLEAIIQRDRIVANTQSQLWDSVVVRIKRKLPHIDDKAVDVIVDIIAKCRNEMAGLIDERVAELQQAMADREELKLNGKNESEGE